MAGDYRHQAGFAEGLKETADGGTTNTLGHATDKA